jgi:sugar lactone lactonase YvrE
MTIRVKSALTIDARATIGEGPTWDAAKERLLWSDNAVGTIYEAICDPNGRWRESRQWNVGRPMGAAIARAKGGLVVVAGTDIFMLDDAGHITPFAHLDADPKVVKLNDAKCDTQGRLWTGTYTHDFTPGLGALYRIDPDGTVNRMLEGVGQSNGLDWSPDGTSLYYIDSFTHTIDAFDFDVARGAISRRRTIVSIPFGQGAFDGMTVDREGCLWVAVFGTGDVRRYTPDGALLARVEISAPAVTSCAFGGIDLGDLLITSAAIPIPDAVLPILGCSKEMVVTSHIAPGAGGLFVCRPGVKGKPATPFAG